MKLTKTILLFSAVTISSLCSCSDKRSISKDKWKELAEKCSYEQASSATITISSNDKEIAKEFYVASDRGWEGAQSGGCSSILLVKANTFTWQYYPNSTIYYFDNLSTRLIHNYEIGPIKTREAITVKFNKNGFVNERTVVTENKTNNGHYNKITNKISISYK